MKRLFIATLLTLLFAAALAAAIQYDPGYVLIAFGGYTLETTVWVGLALLLLILLAMYLVVALLHRSLRRDGLFSRWRAERRQRRSQQQTTRGMIALVEGHYDRARRSFDRAADLAEQPLVNYLLAARASAAQGDPEQAQRYLERAEAEGSGGSAVVLARAELQLQQGRLEHALATLNQLQGKARREPGALKLLQAVHLGLADWHGLQALLPDLRKQSALTDEQLHDLELRVAAELLREAGAPRAPAAAETRLADLRARWQGLSKAATRDSRLVALYARELAAAGAEQDAERLLRDALKREWTPELLDVYGRVAGADAGKQLQFAEQWLPDHPMDAALLRCLGRLSLRNRLWGKARDYFESSLRLENSAETCAELGRLLAHLGQPEPSRAYFERGLLASAPSLPALPLPEAQRIA